MNEWMTTSLALLAEATAVFGGVILFYLFYYFRQKKRDRAIIVKLVKRLKEKEGVRKENLKKILSECCGREEADATEIMETLSSREKTLYCNVIKMFLGRDRDKIKRLDEDVQALVRAYQKLVLEGANSEEESEHKPSQLSYTALRKENETLYAANESLQSELNDSKKAMENMMKEYATMYAGGQYEGEFEVREEMSKLRERDWTDEEGDATGEATGEETALPADSEMFDENTDDIPELLETSDAPKNKAS